MRVSFGSHKFTPQITLRSAGSPPDPNEPGDFYFPGGRRLQGAMAGTVGGVTGSFVPLALQSMLIEGATTSTAPFLNAILKNQSLVFMGSLLLAAGAGAVAAGGAEDFNEVHSRAMGAGAHTAALVCGALAGIRAGAHHGPAAALTGAALGGVAGHLIGGTLAGWLRGG